MTDSIKPSEYNAIDFGLIDKVIENGDCENKVLFNKEL